MNDTEIVDLFWARSESAISEASKKYGRLCRSIAMNILSNSQDTEECVNDTFFKAWNSMPENRPTVLSAFLGRITRNLAYNRYKHKHVQKRGGGEITLVFEELEDCISSDKSILSELEANELAKLISDFLRTLNEEIMIIFVRRYWFSDSIATISEQFGMSESKVKSILFRCRKKLKLYLEREGVIL